VVRINATATPEELVEIEDFLRERDAEREVSLAQEIGLADTDDLP
jgi:hypothetical protein